MRIRIVVLHEARSKMDDSPPDFATDLTKSKAQKGLGAAISEFLNSCPLYFLGNCGLGKISCVGDSREKLFKLKSIGSRNPPTAIA